MANNTTVDDKIFKQVKQHYDVGFQETEKRATGRNRIGTISFNEADELFRSWIDESTWPYDALLFDPRVFTFILEKTSRLISNKPEGTLVPREGSDVIGARINNELLSYQWDSANYGGTMLSKWAMMDMNTRKYGASFALATWRYETDKSGNVLFDGPEMKVLNNRDIAHDLTGTAIENCNWFHVRQYVTWQDLKTVNDEARSKPIYKNLAELKKIVDSGEDSVKDGGDSRSVNWQSRNRAIAGLESDPIGKDGTFKTIEIVTEYRRDKWITFSPKHGIIIREIDNPYKNNELPIVMLRYYAIDDDLYGVSEIEPIKGLQKAINAILCQYIDEINQNLYTPIAIGPGVRQQTLEWGKGARWIMNNPNSDFRLVESHSNAAQFFNNTYSVLVAAMMNTLGESSLGVSNTQPYQADKTATEVKALQLQRNARDNFNQISLAEAIKRQYMLWFSMNQVLLFSDPKALWYPLRVAGPDTLQFLQAQGLSDMVLPDETAQFTQDRIMNSSVEELNNIDISPEGLTVPKFPVKNKEGVFTPKLKLGGNDKGGTLLIEPADVKGGYDFIIDVQSMQVTANEEKKQARQQAISLLTSNPNVTAMLGAENTKPKFKELFVTWLEDLGFSDAEKYFESASAPATAPTATPASGGGMDAMLSALGKASGSSGGSTGGIPGGTNPNAGGEVPQPSPFETGLGPASPKSLS
jgi:hypothetical protein